MSGRADDRRLIEDYLPIEAISKEASREKSVRKGHISTLHLWWARRPLVACRAAVYGALVPASRFRPQNGPEEKRESLTRANAAKFVERLCKYPGDAQVIAEAQRHILEAHAERLTQETGRKVTFEDIVEGRAPRPKVLDMFAGGGAIPLEVLRLGCEAYALDINPVAHIIELCTLVYPQKYGKPDKNAKGSAKDGTWAGLAEEVRYWGNWVLDKVRAEISDLYPPIPDPNAPKTRQVLGKAQLEMTGKGFEHPGQQKLAVETSAGYLTPVAYLWTRTVKCKNPTCGGTVPLVKQTWLCKKDGRYVALKMVASKRKKEVTFEVVEAPKAAGLGFDPEAFSKGGNATCPFCQTTIDSQYVREEGRQKRYGLMFLALAGTTGRGKSYLSAPLINEISHLEEEPILERAANIAQSLGVTLLPETIQPTGNAGLATGINFLHGMDSFCEMFTPRQLVALLTFCKAIRSLPEAQIHQGIDDDRAHAVATFQGLILGKLASLNCSLTRWKPDAELPVDAFGFQRFQMVWDFAEANPISGFGSSWQSQMERTISGLVTIPLDERTASVSRGSATHLEHSANHFDAVITDPPYYDNISYSELADFFYVWLKRAIGNLFPQHFASELTPKKQEIVAAAYRHNGSLETAKRAYEEQLEAAWREAGRILKPNATLVCVYAHKTTIGWATLVDSLRGAGFSIEEAWPLHSEMAARVSHQEDAALASSIFIVARKRDPLAKVGNYETNVVPELESIVRERVETLWEMGISGADLVIACVGAGLRALTKYSRVEYGNGEEVPATRFLAEVETVVLETILQRLSKEVGGKGGQYSLAGLDPPTRFYVLWRYTYKAADLDAGEAIIFANGTHVELDGVQGLSSGARALVAKNKNKYHLLGYTERGADSTMGFPSDHGQSAPLVDALHRLLWLMERHPSGIPEFLNEARPNTEQMRLVAQALAGPALKGGELGEVASGSELAALTKLTANWRSVVEDATGEAAGPLFKTTRQRE
jgi:putative DNA methylase